MKVEFSAKTDTGKVRKANEDSFCILQHAHTAYICDGMGGHVAGALASSLGIETIKQLLPVFQPGQSANQMVKDLFIQSHQSYPPQLPPEAIRLVKATQLANLHIYNTTIEKPDLQGMGTTGVGISFFSNLYAGVHVGDSRAYRIRHNKISQLTADHSWLNELVQAGRLKPENTENFPHKNVITRALGVGLTVPVDLKIEPIEKDDVFLLSSDGLHDLVNSETILDIYQKSNNLDEWTTGLVTAANNFGGKDNITVVAAHIIELDDTPNNLSFQGTIPTEEAEIISLEAELLELLFKNEATISENTNSL
ncbi:serine/threonine-protein phosphatase [bacterium]|nr:serine/threonine-protein phosphatase [bacterium]